MRESDVNGLWLRFRQLWTTGPLQRGPRYGLPGGPPPQHKFTPQIERAFVESFESYNFFRRRVAQAVGAAGILGFALVDFTSSGGAVARTDWVLLALVLPVLLVPIAANFKPGQTSGPTSAPTSARAQYGFIALFVAGIGAAGTVDIGHNTASWLHYESMVLVSLYVYFVSGLTFARALVCGLGAGAAFVAAQWQLGQGQIPLRETAHLALANMMGALGLFYLEQQAREKFVLERELHSQAMLDGLTGVYNRSAMQTHLERIWAQAQRDGKPLALLMLDLDHFKMLNDRHGHTVGDACLNRVTDVLVHHARRPLDAVGRYGGDEFLAVWYDADSAWFEALSRDLPEQVRSQPASRVVDVPPVSVSGGAVRVLPRAGMQAAYFLALADEKLYEAKRKARGTIAVIDFLSQEQETTGPSDARTPAQQAELSR